MKEDDRPDEGVVDPPRFRSCRRAVDVRIGASGATEPSPYRRCPVGVIAAVDCPEYAGRRCGFHEDRAGEPATVVPLEETAALGRELSLDYLTPAYARRIAALRSGPAAAPRGKEVLAASPVEAPAVEPPLVRRARLVAPGPVNVLPDRARPPAPRSAR